GTAFYWAFMSSGTQGITNLQDRTSLIPLACTFDNFFVAHQSDAAQPNMTYTYSLVKMVSGSPSNTALTCGATTVTGSTVTCSDTTHTVSAASGDQFAFGAVTSDVGTTPVGNILVSVRCK